MSDANIDQNTRNTLTAYNDTTGFVEELRVDPVLGALLIYGIPNTGGTFTDLDHASIDGNGRNTLSAWNENKNRIEAMRCSNEGYLLIKPV